MGASSSTDHKASTGQREAESIAASSGALRHLQTAFSTLADPLNSNSVPLDSLKRCFSLSYKNPVTQQGSPIPESFLGLLENLGPSIVDLLFVAGNENEGVSWLEFVRGYNKCCSRMSLSLSLNMLLRIFAVAAQSSGLALNLEFGSEEDGSDCKFSGFLLPSHVVMLVWACWSMAWDSQSVKQKLLLPDVSHIVESAIGEVVGGGGGSDVWGRDISAMEVQIPAGKFQTWVLQTVPSLPDCWAQFVHARIQSCGAREVEDDDDDPESSCSSEGDVSGTHSGLLTRGTAWAISLTMRSAISEELSRVCFSRDSESLLLYRSSLHGRGLNRFWSNVEGYQGPILMLISACLQNYPEDSITEMKWTIGILTQQGFENKEAFYGSSGHLYALCPVFHAYPSIGKEKNFVYSHLHPTGRLYEPHPKPVGIGFGGTVGNERIFVDEDFAKVTVRHHAVDKTYGHGFLFPDQGFLPVEAVILEVEVWGLGGKGAKCVQDKYKRREELFTQQRRKVDLKTFATWEDSPEKMMMDMMSDPNAVRREDR